MSNIDEKLLLIVNACNDKKGFDIKILDLKDLTTITDYFVIVSGNSTTQVTAIADEIQKKMDEAGYEIIGREGYGEAKWILLDYGSVVVHVFHKDDREFYNLEKVWADSKELILDNVQ
mgnify:CR=1 FL=1